MICKSVQHSLSAHIDGRLSPEARLEVSRHLAECAGCEARLREIVRVRRAVRNMPAPAAPADLNGKLRNLATRERLRRAKREAFWPELAARFSLWVDNLMRPLALPFAGGLISAIVLFSVLTPSFSFRRYTTANDVRVGWFTDAAVKTQDPFGFPEEECVVEAIVDGQGRVVDYTIQGAETMNPELRRQVENKLLFTSFTPATAFGQPTTGRVVIYFNRTHVNVKSS